MLVREGRLGAGLGARPWPCAGLLCRALAEERSLRDAEVLELGCGVGVCGISAAVLGARRVVLTDCVPDVLDLAAANIGLNASRVLPGTCHVRWFDWTSDSANFGEGLRKVPERCVELGRDEVFPLVIGSDILYVRCVPVALSLCTPAVSRYSDEAPQLVSAVLARRLSPGGRAVLACPVRERSILRAFLDCAAHRGLLVHCSEMASEESVCGEHDGGVSLLVVTKGLD